MQLYLGELGPVRIFGRTLVILCSYRGGARHGGPWRCSSRFGGLPARLLNAITLLPLRAHIALLRDHYANPKAFSTQRQIAEAALAFGRPATLRVVIDAPLDRERAGETCLGVDPEVVTLARALPDLRKADTIVLVYPDALGLGFGKFEARLLTAGAKNVVVVSGRRRLFPLTATARRSLRWRRMLASTRLPELAAAIAVVLLAVPLACRDRLRGRT